MAKINIIEADGRETQVKLSSSLTQLAQETLQMLSDRKLLTRKHFDGLEKWDLTFFESLKELNTLGVLNSDMIDCLIKRLKTGSVLLDWERSNDSGYYACAILKTLSRNNLLTQKNALAILSYPFSRELFNIIGQLDTAIPSLLKVNNINKLLSYKNPINLVARMQRFVQSTDRLIQEIDGPETQLPPIPQYMPEEEAYIQAKSGISILSKIISKLEGLITQARLDMIVQHSNPGELDSILEKLQKAHFPIEPYLDMILSHSNTYFLSNVIDSLDWKNILTQKTLEYTVRGDIKPDTGGLLNGVDAIEILIKENLHVPENYAFITTGRFTASNPINPTCGHDAFLNAKTLQYLIWSDYSKRNTWHCRTTTSLPTKKVALAETIPEFLQQLQDMTREYIIQSKESTQYRPLCHWLFSLQQELSKSYRQFEQDKNTTTLETNFLTQIAHHRTKIQRAYGILEHLSALLNRLLNAVQALLTDTTKKKALPWGHFFAQGERLALVAQLETVSTQNRCLAVSN